MRRVCTLTAACVAFAALSSSAAQEPAKPGPEHEHFKQLEGVWDAIIHSPQGDSKGTMSSKIGLNGLWLLDHFKGDVAGGAYEGMGATSYDPAKKKYVGIWIDSMSTTPTVSEGTLDSTKKIMTMSGMMNTPDGKSMKMNMVTRITDADNFVFTLTSPGPDGKDFEMMKITYKRKAK